jgi:predicted amidophosphoribosyltransferase
MRAALPYDGLLRAAIVEFKRGRRAFASDLATLVAPLIDTGTTLVPVPTTRRRIAERGFDQAILLARSLQRRCGVGVAELLCRPRSAAQHGRSRSERLAARGRFALIPAAKASAGSLVLFDDVRTTGATLLDAAEALNDGGFEVREALTLAWTPST